jgi:hypothetical protein
LASDTSSTEFNFLVQINTGVYLKIKKKKNVDYKMYETHTHVSVRLDNTECLIGEKVNAESNTNKNTNHSNAWRTDLNSKGFINSAKAQTEEFKIQTVINHYATLEN